MSNHSKRKFCAHCGSTDSWRMESTVNARGGQFFYVECRKCGARGPKSFVQHEVDKLWNTRADAALQVAFDSG